MITQINWLHKTLMVAVALFVVFGTANIALAQTDESPSDDTEREKPTLLRGVIDRVENARDRVFNSAGENMRASTTKLQMETRTDAMLNVPTSTRLKIEARIEASAEARAERQQEREERLVEIKARVSERTYAVIERIMERMDSAFVKLSDLLARLDAKITESADAGVDVSAAAAASATASVELGEARVAISAAQTVIAEASASENPREYIERIRTAVREAASALKSAHRAIFNVITELRAAIGGDARLHAEANGQASSDE